MNLQDYIGIVLEYADFFDGEVVFRGHSRRDFRIEASVFRKVTGAEDREAELLYALMTEHPEEFSASMSAFESLSLAQHHGLPTRLLDVTSSPLVALYFAASTHTGVGGKVLVFQVDKSRVKNFDSDSLSCVCNLAKLTQAERSDIADFLRPRKGRLSKLDQHEIDEFNELSATKRLVQFVKHEKPYFDNAVQPITLWSNYLARPAQSSSRVVAQSGAFLVSGVLKVLGNSHKIDKHEISVPAKYKRKLLAELDAVGINRKVLFPGLESTATYLREKI